MVLETNNREVVGKLNHISEAAMSSPKSVTENPKSDIDVKTVEDCLEVVVSWIEGTYGKSYFVAPLDDFQARYGKVNSEDDFYQSRMNYFLEYCVLERPLNVIKGGMAPVSKFLEQHSHLTAGNTKQAALWREFCGFRHSLLQVEQTGEELVQVKDLIIDKTLMLRPKAGETLKYLRKKSIFQGFIFGHHEEFVLGQGQIIHPEPANKEILRFIQQHRRVPRVVASELLRMLALTNMRYLRMQHVNPTVIYQAISN